MTSDSLFEKCMKCTLCNDFCPLAGVSDVYPGPKKAGPDSIRLILKDAGHYDRNLKLCLNCRRCEVACPSEVDIADIIVRTRFEYEKPGIHTPRNYLMANTDLTGTLGSAFAPIANIAAGLMFPHGGPRYAGRTFMDWYRKEAAASQESFAEKVTYFHGCYVNYNNPQQGKDLIKVFNAAGIGVRVLKGEKCCGTALIANGFRKQAMQNAESDLKILSREVAAGRTIVSTGSSCALTIRDDWKNLLHVDNSDIRESVTVATKYLYERLESGLSKIEFKPGKKLRIAYHTSCHMAKLGWNIYTISLLRMLPDVELILLDSNCCGSAGTWGYKPEHSKMSKAIGEKLFAQIAEVNPDFVVSDCETCNWQIEMHTNYKAINPVTVLAMYL